MTATFTSRTAWKQTYSRRRSGFLRANDRFMTTDPHEAPEYLRAPHRASEWVAMTHDARVAHARQVAHDFVIAQIGEAPGARPKPTITLGELERRVIEDAEQKCDDLRFVLNGTPAAVEARVSAQRPHFRAEVFDTLTRRYRVLN